MVSKPVFNSENIPPELHGFSRFVLWRYQIRNGKQSKPPYQLDGKFASPNNPATWNPYQAVIDAYRNGDFAGIGFMLTKDVGIVCIDLDHCIQSDNTLTPIAQQIVGMMVGTYTEISPSGDGLHIWCKGVLPEGGRRKGGVEMYDSDRYITLTGNLYPNSYRKIIDCTDKLKTIHSLVFNAQPQKEREDVITNPSPPLPVDDRTVIDMLSRSKRGDEFNALMSGNHNGDHSAADLSLCNMLAFGTRKDAAMMDTIFRTSGLMREKWDQPHYADGRTYGQGTIETAILDCHEIYNGRSNVISLPQRDALRTESSDTHTWPTPQPLTAKIEPIPYPVDALPDSIRAAVEEVVDFVQSPISIVAGAALAAVSLVAQPFINVSRVDRLTGPIGLFLLTIADSGERKSTCDGFFTQAIRKYEEEQAEAVKPTIKDYQGDMQSWEAECQGVKEKIRQLTKAGDDTDKEKAAMRKLEADKPQPPKVPRLLYADATPEALAYSLWKGWPSAGIVSAEGGTVFGAHGMNKDSVMRNLALLNQLWDGAPITIDRRTTDSFTVRNARLTMALQVQEPAIREFIDKTGTLARGTGFLARFLVSWPESTQGTRLFRESPNHWSALIAFNERIAEILKRPVPINEDTGVLTPNQASLSREAKSLWIEYHNTVEIQLSIGGDLYDVRDVASKSADNAARLAALFYMFDDYGGYINAESFERASAIAAWHLYESRRFFGELALPVELRDAARLDAWLIGHCKREHIVMVSTRDAQQFGPIRNHEKLMAALSVLSELSRLRVKQSDRRKIITINPALVPL